MKDVVTGLLTAAILIAIAAPFIAVFAALSIRVFNKLKG